MKKEFYLAVFASCFFISQAFATSPGYDDLVKLIQSGVDEDVVLSYIDASSDAYRFTPDEIIYLKDMGVSSKVITEAINHGKQLQQTTQSQTENTEKENVNNETINPQPASPPNGQKDISYFYNSLAPYGKWMQVDGTWCWKPFVADFDISWQPYGTQGHWVYTDAGWTWASEYSWGWAPFHYGRWLRHPHHGWIWYPDNVWGPAWVTWRHNDNVCGWAPLPPHSRYVEGRGFYYNDRSVNVDFDFGLLSVDFVFCPVAHFVDPHPWEYRIPSHRVDVVFHETRVINDSYGYEHERFINRGVPVATVETVTKRRIEPVTIVSVADVHHGNGEVVGRQISLFRPNIVAVAKTTPVQMQSVQHMQQHSAPNENLLKRRQDAALHATMTHEKRAQMAEENQRQLEKQAALEKQNERRAVLVDQAQQQHEIARIERVKAEKTKHYAHPHDSDDKEHEHR